MSEAPTETKCPVCNGPTKTSNDYLEGVTCESDEVCPNGCYFYQFCYGSSILCIGDREWGWHHTESPEEYRKRDAEIKQAIEDLKQCL